MSAARFTSCAITAAHLGAGGAPPHGDTITSHWRSAFPRKRKCVSNPAEATSTTPSQRESNAQNKSKKSKRGRQSAHRRVFREGSLARHLFIAQTMATMVLD